MSRPGRSASIMRFSPGGHTSWRSRSTLKSPRSRYHAWSVPLISAESSTVTVRSQAYSGIIMGIGMALMEHTAYDRRDGGIVTSNLADYAVLVNADVHAIDIHFIDKPDLHIDSMGLGARGAGEIPITGVTPAIAN